MQYNGNCRSSCIDVKIQNVRKRGKITQLVNGGCIDVKIQNVRKLVITLKS